MSFDPASMYVCISSDFAMWGGGKMISGGNQRLCFGSTLPSIAISSLRRVAPGYTYPLSVIPSFVSASRPPPYWWPQACS